MVVTVFFLNNACWNGGECFPKNLNFLINGRKQVKVGESPVPEEYPSKFLGDMYHLLDSFFMLAITLTDTF